MTPDSDLGTPVILSIKTPIPHNGATISGTGPVTITTRPEQWSYAAGFRFRKADLPRAERLLVRVEATVQQGHIGIAFVKNDLNQILGDEARTPLDGSTVADILVDEVPESGWVIIRNNAAGGVQSQCVLHGIKLYGLAASPLRGFAEWAPGDETGSRVFKAIREKWNEIPVGLGGRRKTADLLKLDDTRLQTLWVDTHREATAGAGYSARGWYQDLYSDALRCKTVLDVGSGFGMDGITFARAGAHVTFVDVVASNLDLVRRLCRIFRIESPEFLYLEDFGSLDRLPPDFDVIWCQGSMLHVPFEFACREAQRLLQHLRTGGRWIELTYPRERWQRDGSPPFDQWGRYTDGAATPWAQWYDLQQILERLKPARFDTILAFNFHDNDFNWFDLIRRS